MKNQLAVAGLLESVAAQLEILEHSENAHALDNEQAISLVAHRAALAGIALLASGQCRGLATKTLAGTIEDCDVLSREFAHSVPDESEFDLLIGRLDDVQTMASALLELVN